MTNEKAVYLIKKIIGHQREMDELRRELLKMHSVDVAYVDEGELYISSGMQNLGVPLTETRLRGSKRDFGFTLCGTFVFTEKEDKVNGGQDNG